MTKKYNFKHIEEKWQKIWDEAGIFKAVDFDKKPKFYGLIEFPYPSGSGMHVGHIKAYSSIEVVARKRRMQGYNVLFPIGFDAFGLPTENYAIKTNTHPRVITDVNISNFTHQLKKVGFSFDWSRAIDTTSPEYYKWTQWIFLKMYENGLVYKSKTLVNYCPHCKVVLSNEDSQGGKCDVCGTDIVQRSKDVWYLKITNYAEKLLSGLKNVDYTETIIQQEINWIGKSEGAFIKFGVKDCSDSIEVFTTRPDTIFGVTFIVIAPEHPLIEKMHMQIKNMDAIIEYRTACSKKTEFERIQLSKEKTGLRVEGIAAINPLAGNEIPVYISDYVMVGYGTGAIMAVPAHDQRDWEFAKKYNLPIVPVIEGGDIEHGAYVGDGTVINSDFLNGCNKNEAIAQCLFKLCECGIGYKGIQYKMKDWAFNRQRYWGEPIPLIHCDKCGTVPVPYQDLPVLLPEVDKFEPGEDGESPLAKIDQFVICTCPKCGGIAKRETDTMPQWAGSSWYFLRYCDPNNPNVFADIEKLKYWLPVDWYNGGMEHVTRHLLYSRFWHKFLYDINAVPTEEPYSKRTAQGLILGSDGNKMSKSKGNVVDPLDIVSQYGADVLRTYILFMGEYGSATPWNDKSVQGVKRFIERVAGLVNFISEKNNVNLDNLMHKTICKVSNDIEEMKFNTAIACMMSLLNEIYKEKVIGKEQVVNFLKLLSPFAPHITEEIYHEIGFTDLLTISKWPSYDEQKIIDDTVEIAIQINGRVRCTLSIPINATKEDVQKQCRVNERIKEILQGKEIVREIYVPGKILNYVIKT